MELEISHLVHRYAGGKTAIQEMNLKLTPGVYGLLGPNGAGKSTLLNIITDNLRPTGGSVFFNGKNIQDSAHYRSQLGFVPQQQNIYKQFTGMHFLRYMSALKGIDRKMAEKKCRALLEVVGLSESANQRIGRYSGGMKQRLLIAQALLNDPSILILDEPTAGLDPNERIRIRNYISEFSCQKIVLFATHVVSDVACIAKEMILLKKGVIIRQDVPNRLAKEIEGKVWEFVVDFEELKEVQKKYLISNITSTGEGILVRAVGESEEIPRTKRPVQPGMEDVYLYYMEHENQ